MVWSCKKPQSALLQTTEYHHQAAHMLYIHKLRRKDYMKAPKTNAKGSNWQLGLYLLQPIRKVTLQNIVC